MNIKKIIIYLVVLTFVPSFTHGATDQRVYLKSSSEAVEVGSEIIFGLFVEGDIPINAFYAQIGYSLDTLEFTGYSDANSIVDIWRDKPSLQEPGIIKARGGMLSAFNGRAGEIAKLKFIAKKEGIAQVSVRDTLLYAADGIGTEIFPNTSFAEVNVVSEDSLLIEDTAEDKVQDETPPRILVFEAVAEPINNRKLIALYAKDEVSGVDDIQIKYSRLFHKSSWRNLFDTEVIPSDAWRASIKVKDGAGLESRASIIVIPNTQTIFIVITVIIAVLILMTYLKKRYIIN